MIKRFLIIFMLGFSSGLPLALVSTTLQAWFADVGMSVLATGMLSLISVPYLYRFLWAPFLDRYALCSKLGKRRSWILAMQLLLCVGFNVMAWFSPLTSPFVIASLGFILASLSATQDASIDAHRTEYLSPNQYGLGASFAMIGYRLALLAAGGLALIIAQYAGWVIAYRVMGCLMLVGVFAILWSPEPSTPLPVETSLKESLIAPVKNLITRPGIIPLCLFVIFYKFGEAFTTSTSGIVMPFLIQGIGFSLETIAYVNKILGVVAIVLGGLSAGVILLRWSLYRALFVFGLIQALTNALFVLLAMVGKNVLLFSAAVVSDNFAAGMGSTAIVALFMRFVDQRYTATQFSLLVAFATMPRVFSGPIGAFLQAYAGWVGLYQISFILAFVFIPFLWILRQQQLLRTHALV